MPVVPLPQRLDIFHLPRLVLSSAQAYTNVRQRSDVSALSRLDLSPQHSIVPSTMLLRRAPFPLDSQYSERSSIYRRTYLKSGFPAFATSARRQQVQESQGNPGSSGRSSNVGLVLPQ